MPRTGHSQPSRTKPAKKTREGDGYQDETALTGDMPQVADDYTGWDASSLV
jgi:hypothetical protein